MTGELAVVDINPTVAHPARIYDYLLGGGRHFAADRIASEQSFRYFPGGVDGARANARANRLLLGRAVRYLVAEAGLRQFLDVGTGIPTANNVHQVAQEIAPEARIVYIDNDPVVLAHAHSLLTSTREGATDYINGDLRDPQSILLRAEATLDFSQPVAVMLIGVLHFLTDDQAYPAVDQLLDAVPAGSYLAISHLASDIRAEEMAEMAKLLAEKMNQPMVLRSCAEVAGFFDRLELVDPGVVPVAQWRPDAGAPASDPVCAIHCALGRKP